MQQTTLQHEPKYLTWNLLEQNPKASVAQPELLLTWNCQGLMNTKLSTQCIILLLLGEHCSVVSVQIQEICFLWFCLCLRQTQIKAKLRAVAQNESTERRNKGQNADLYPAGAYPGHTAKRGHPLPWDSWQQNQGWNISGWSWEDMDQSANPTQVEWCALAFTGVASQQQSSNSARN